MLHALFTQYISQSSVTQWINFISTGNNSRPDPQVYVLTEHLRDIVQDTIHESDTANDLSASLFTKQTPCSLDLLIHL